MALRRLYDDLSPASRAEIVTHRSWASGSAPSFERLELLGDAVLQVIVTESLMARHPGASEGELAWMRQSIVDRGSCASAAIRSGLVDELTAAAPPDLSGRAAVLASERVHAALTESLIGAAWQTFDLDRVRREVIDEFESALAAAVPGSRDPKTALQEAAARQQLEVRYVLTGSTGPAHNTTFASVVLVGERELGTGSGPSKRASETAAASVALRHFEGH